MIRFKKIHAVKKIHHMAGLMAVAVCLVFLWADFLLAMDFDIARVAILASRNIRPYAEAVEGISAVLTKLPAGALKVFYLDKFRKKDQSSLSKKIAGQGFRLLIAVGPEAANFIRTDKALRKSATLYSVLLNPEKVLGPQETFCGIPLNIPVQKQIEMIRRSLPKIGRIGLLYDPRYNLEFLENATRDASSLGIKITPLEVSSKKEIPRVLKKNWGKMDVLWLIPDRTVISESIVRYAIKESLLNGVPVIGYNRFFYDSGAVLSFVFDYQELGKQCGEKAIRLINGEGCKAEPPVFHVWINTRVMKKLDMSIAQDYTLPIEVGP